MLEDQYEQSVRAEQAVKAAAESISDELRMTWGLGDGNGGWVFEVMRSAAGAQDIPQTTSNSPSKIPTSAKIEVVCRDGKACAYCGRELDAGEVTFDHVIPRSKGGPDTPINLVVACRSCNSRKGVSCA